MSNFTFEDYVRATMGGAKNAADGSPLTQAQVDRVANYLKSPGSGPDGTTSYETYVTRQMAAHPPELPRGMDYVGFSGTDSAGTSNFQNAADYKKQSGRSGIIGDTPWGKFINQTNADPEFGAIETKFRGFLSNEGIRPYGGNVQGALQDMMWNAGSSPYLSNAVNSGRPVAAFVENAPLNRGFSTFELPTALNTPSAVMNGYPMSAFGHDPLAFASKSAAEFQQLETHLAQSASLNGNHTVSVADIRANVDVNGGYDAVNKTLFGQSVDDFSKLSLGQMTAASRTWTVEQAKTAGRIASDPEAGKPGTPAVEQNPPTGPPRGIATAAIDAEARAASEPLVVSAEAAARGSSGVTGAAGKVLGAGGVVLMGYDAYQTAQQYQALSAKGNQFGADALLHQYEGRTAGGVLGGIAAGAAYGAVAGSESGPGALVTGAVGGVVGAFAGDRIATAYNEHQVNHQTGTNGVTYAYDQGRWTQTEHHLGLNSYDLPTVKSTTTPAPADQLSTLDYQRTTAVTALALANPAMQDTKAITLAGTEWRASREGWTKEVQQTYAGLPQADDFGRPITVSEKADANTGKQLDQLAANRQYNNDHYGEKVAQAYVMDYYGQGWHKNGPLPEAVTSELKRPSETQIKDPVTGNTWTADGKGGFSRSETSVGYDTPVTTTVKAEGAELARVGKLQQEAVQSNAAYGSQLIAEKYAQSQAPIQQQAPTQPAATLTPEQHATANPAPMQATSPTTPQTAAATPDVSAPAADAAKAAPTSPSPEYLALSAQIARVTQALETGDRAALQKEAQPYLDSPAGKAFFDRIHAAAPHEEHQRAQREAQQPPRDPRDARHPDHALNDGIRSQVETLYTRNGRFPTNQDLARLTASVARDAREHGLTRVDQLHFNGDKTTILAVQNSNNNNMMSGHSVTNVQQAMQTTPEHAYQQMAQETQRQATAQQERQQPIAQTQQAPSQGR